MALSHPIFCILGARTRHPYRRGYEASPTRMASPFAPGFARSCVWRQLLAVNGQPVVPGLVLCRRPILPGDRVQKVPFPFPPRPGSLNLELEFEIMARRRQGIAALHCQSRYRDLAESRCAAFARSVPPVAGLVEAGANRDRRSRLQRRRLL